MEWQEVPGQTKGVHPVERQTKFSRWRGYIIAGVATLIALAILIAFFVNFVWPVMLFLLRIIGYVVALIVSAGSLAAGAPFA